MTDDQTALFTRFCTTCGEEEGTEWSRTDCTYEVAA